MAMFVAAAPLPPPTAPQSPRFPLTLLLIPIAALSKHGTGITWADLWEATKPPFLSGLLAGAAGLLVKLTLGGSLAQILYLAVGLAVVLGIYAWVLLIFMGQKHMYMDVLSQLLPRTQPRQEGTVELIPRREHHKAEGATIP